MIEHKQKEQITKKNKPGKWIWLIGVIAVMVVIAVIVGSLWVSKQGNKSHYAQINTPYIDLLVPEELKDVITSDESTYGTVYTRAFYMHYGEIEIPLWRIDFGDANMGDWVGMLRTDNGDIPVVMTAFAASEEELAALDEEGYKLFNDCMQAYSVMLDGIIADPRFSPDRPLAVGEDTSVKLTYWTVTLPNTMKVSENTADGNYEAVFSAEVVGEMVPLYRVCIGELQAESFLGYFEIGGVKQPVSVEAFALAERANWSEDDYAAAYRMMDTINDVINTIMSSKQFSTEAE